MKRFGGFCLNHDSTEDHLNEHGYESDSAAGSAENGTHRAADLVSKVLTPQFIGFLVVLVFAFMAPTGTGPILNSLQCFLLGVLFVVVLPISPVLVAYARGKVDIWVSSREARTFYFALAVLAYLAGAVVFSYEKATAMYAISLTYGFVTLAVAIINLKWKISVHTAGVSGPSTALVYVFGLAALPFFALVIPVAWARIKLKAHTVGQSIAGIIVAMLVTLGVYALAYPIRDPGFFLWVLLQNFLPPF